MERRTPWRASGATIPLMAVLVVIFALQCINDVYLKSFAEAWLALTPAWVLRGYVWQLLTFQFLHGGVWHLFGNLLGLWFFGRFVEEVLGWRRYLLAYFGCGVVGGILQGVLMVVFPQHFSPVVFGASAGVSGIFAIFVYLDPSSEIRWNFIMPVRASVLLWVYGGVALFFTVVPSGRGGAVAHAAHLGGILAGLGFVKMKWHQDFRPLPIAEWFAALKRRPRKVVKLPRTAAAEVSAARPWNPTGGDDLPPAEFISREVDPILDKISEHGIQSLTPRERRILEAARSKMEKRTRGA